MITLAPGVLERSFEHLRRCGEAKRECVVLWASSLSRTDRVEEVVHPRHRASAGGYEIDPLWISEFWLELAEHRQTVRAQIHTHPGTAYHSSTDDDFALVHTPGYLSLVVPDFARGPIGLDGCFLAIRGADGAWIPRDPRSTIGVS